MSSYMAKSSELNRKWYIIDATDKPLGRVASAAASILRGKHLPTFTPNVDCGDHVIILNTDKAVLTGKKLEQKIHYYHTGWIGGLKEVKYNKLMAENSDKAMYMAVEGCFLTIQSAHMRSSVCVYTRAASTKMLRRSPKYGQARLNKEEEDDNG